jgi:septal ring factor EnvC (AmiA/AmiB activator)
MITRSPTRQLASAPLQLVYGARSGLPLRALAAVAVACVVLGAGYLHYAGSNSPAARFAAVESEKRVLESELAQLRAELEIERATRAALDQQLADLNQQLGELTRQINFVNAQSGRARAAKPGN